MGQGPSEPPPVRQIAAGRHLELVDAGGWEYARRRHGPEVVAVIARTDAGELILVEQRRRPVGGVVVEFPAGLVGDDPPPADPPVPPSSATGPGDAVLAAAGRELTEETGYSARVLTRLARGPSSAGLTDEMVTFVLAEGLARVGAGGGVEGERITVHRVRQEAIADFLADAVAAGKLLDPRVLAGLYLWERHLRGERPLAAPAGPDATS